MSAASQLQRSFDKYRTTYITILEATDRTGELEALKKRTFSPLKVLYCYWKEATNKDYTEGGESQEYTATIRVLASDISDVATKLDQTCRVVEGVVTGSWTESQEWTIETIVPKMGPGDFRVLEMTLKLSKEGNRVRL